LREGSFFIVEKNFSSFCERFLQIFLVRFFKEKFFFDFFFCKNIFYEEFSENFIFQSLEIPREYLQNWPILEKKNENPDSEIPNLFFDFSFVRELNIEKNM